MNRELTASRRSSGAFTLLEVLMTIAMVAVLLAALHTTLFAALRLREATSERFEAELPRHMIIALIKRDLADIVAPPALPPEPEEGEEGEEPPPEEPEAEEEPEPEVFGPLAGGLLGEYDESSGQRADSLEFFTANAVLNQYDPWGDIQKVEYYLVATGSSNNVDAYDFMRTVNHNLLVDEEDIEEELLEQALLSNVQSMEISYFDGEEWQDSWDTEELENVMPLAIAIRIDFVPPEESELPKDRGYYTPPIELVVPITTQVLPAPPPETEEGGGGGAPGGNQ